MNGGENRVTVEAWEDGAAFYVKARPASRREGVNGVHAGMLKVDVSAAPEKGKANKAILKMLAKLLSVPANSLFLLSGETQSRKKIGVRGGKPDAIREKLGKMS